MRSTTQRALGLVVLAGCLASLAGAVAADRTEAPPKPPEVVLITVDTLRPDALGWIGGKNQTPHLDRLANEGVAFPAAVTPLPLTLPAHASILSGLLPRRHGVRDNGLMFPQSVDTLATRLDSEGYRTAAFVSGFPLQRIFGLDRGFDVYDDEMPDGREGWVERNAEATTRAALSWWRDPPADGPRFLWVHYYDPHDPYEPPRVFWQPGARGPYDGEVSYTDHWIGELLSGLGEPSGDQPRLTVFTADHGEALGEHRESRHGYFVYDSTMLVPLVFHFPGRLTPARSDHPARLIDVAPTVLGLLGLETPPDLDGTSLQPVLAGREQPAKPAYLETQLPYRFFGWAPLSALRHGGWKLIAAPRPELYDLTADPDESENLVHSNRRKARELQATMRTIESAAEAEATASSDPEVVARLRSLGYVGAGGSATLSAEELRGLPDPKDRIAQRDALLAAEDLLRAGRRGEAVRRFDEVLKEDPDSRYATLRSGIALLQLGKLPAATKRLARAVELDPERAEARFAYADALTRLGRLEPATEQWMELIRLQPRRWEAWANLVTVLEQRGECGRAGEAYREALAVAPPAVELGRSGVCSEGSGEAAGGEAAPSG